MGLNEKYILKRAFNNILPKDICSRPKHHYRASIKRSLFDKTAQEHIQDKLSDSAFTIYDFYFLL